MPQLLQTSDPHPPVLLVPPLHMPLLLFAGATRAAGGGERAAGAVQRPRKQGGAAGKAGLAGCSFLVTCLFARGNRVGRNGRERKSTRAIRYSIVPPPHLHTLQDFTQRFSQRFGELFYDVDEAVAVKGVRAGYRCTGLQAS